MMDSNGTQGIYPTISHRAAAGYPRFLAAVQPTAAQGEDEFERSKLDLHAFFEAFYETLYRQPDLFGLPLSEDDCIEDDEPHAKEKKQEVTARLKKPQGLIARGLDFLARAGREGKLEGQDLVLEHGADVVKQTKVGKKFLQGLESAGLVLVTEKDTVTLHNSRFPAMMAALQALAQACAAYTPERSDQFHFARCDFRVLEPGYRPKVVDLIRDFIGEDAGRLMKLHEFFSGMGYQASCETREPFFWLVQYQGNRKIKSTPLFQLEYQERYRRPLRVSIKCASTGRIAALLPHQPQFLQDDFMRRANVCRGDACGWCKNSKTLGPSTVEYRGEKKVLCWYSFPEVRHFNDDSVELIEAYARMHAELLPAE